MKNHEANKLEAANDVSALLHKNEAKINQFKRIPICLGRIDTIRGQIMIKEGVLLSGTTAATETKAVSQDDLVALAMVILGDFLDLGHELSDAELIKLGSMSETAVYGLTKTEFPVLMDTIVKKLDALGTKLADTDLTPEVITEFKSSLTGFKANAGLAGTSRTDIGSARETMTELFRQLAVQLGILKSLMRKFQKTDPEFYSAYITARKIIDRGIRHKPEEQPAPENTPAK